MGGVAINENAQVLDKDGKVIEGLYAAGEVVGGLYGAGRVAGNNTLDDIVFGKISALHAIGK
jgi:succinate dehydrogenase/fumarate reductase flavoprotein subunit